MRYVSVWLLCFIGSLDAGAQHLWQFYEDTVIKWNYQFGDEFNKTAVNTGKWHIGFPWGRNILSQETYVVDSNVILDGSIARFTLKKEPRLIPLETWQIDTNKFKKEKIQLVDGAKFPFKYTGALLWSRRTFQYGYFEIKFKAPSGQGIWPAFWLYAGKANNEIDFFELKGEKEKQIHVDVHCPEGCANYKEFLSYRKGWGHWVNTNQVLSQNYNVVSGEWNKEDVKWYLNGELIAYYKRSFDMPMALTVGTGIAKDKAAFKPGPNEDTPFPNYFDVDYVRVYNLDSLPDKKILQGNFSNSTASPLLITDQDLTARRKGKLKNSSQNPKDEHVVTISLLPIASGKFSLRALGVKSSDAVSVSISDLSGNVIKKWNIRHVFETEIDIPVNFLVQVEVNSRVIKEKISIE